MRSPRSDDVTVRRLSPSASGSEIIFVHGTILFPWLRKRTLAWTRPGSDLHDRIQAARPGAIVSSFDWRGRNRHVDRIEAATKLGWRIDRADRDVVLVGHSHGGNVARMALQSAEASSHRRGLITLGTPFINVRHYEAPEEWRLADAAYYSPVAPHRIAVLLATLLLGMLVFWTLDRRQVGWEGAFLPASSSEGVLIRPDLRLEPLSGFSEAATRGFVGAFNALWFPIAVALVITAALGVAAGAAMRHRIDLPVRDVLSKVDTRNLAAPSYVVAAEDDEAGWALSLGQIVGSIGSFISSRAFYLRLPGQKSGWTVGTFLLVAALAPYAWGLYLVGSGGVAETDAILAAHHTIRIPTLTTPSASTGPGLSPGRFPFFDPDRPIFNPEGTSRLPPAEFQFEWREWHVTPSVKSNRFVDWWLDPLPPVEAALARAPRLLGGFADEVLAVIGTVLVVLAAVGLIGAAIVVGEYFSTGWDSLPFASYARMSVSPMAPGTATTELLNLTPVRSGRAKRHSRLYADQRAIDTVAEHATALLSDPTPEPASPSPDQGRSR